MTPERNERLRAARISARLTQDSLASQVNAVVERETRTAGAMTANAVSKWERGLYRYPQKVYRDALRQVLGTDSDDELGFYPPQPPAATVVGDVEAEMGGDVKRQAFLKGMAAAVGMAIGAPAAEADDHATMSGPAPTRVGATDVAQVNHAISVFDSWQDRFGGGACMDAIAGQVNQAVGLLAASGTSTTRRDLHSSVGFLANVAGWGAFDAGYHNAARAYFTRAVDCAEKADDWGLRSNVLSDMARQAIYIKRHDDALSLIELAQVRQDRLTPTVRAMLSVVRARALAAVGRGDDSYDAVLRAEDHFSHTKPDNDPPWITYFGRAELDGDTGHALLDVALTGNRVGDARERLTRSLNSYEPGQARARAFSLGKLAILELTAGDVEHGISYGKQALAAEAPLSSRRARDDLNQVHKELNRHRNLPAARELHSRLKTALAG